MISNLSNAVPRLFAEAVWHTACQLKSHRWRKIKRAQRSLKSMITTLTKPTSKSDSPKQFPFQALHRHWKIGLLLAALLALAVYLFLTYSSAELSRAAQRESNTQRPSVPVVAAAAKIGDITVYLTGLGLSRRSTR